MTRIFLLCAVFTVAIQARELDVRVLESTDRSLTVEFRPTYSPVQTIVAGADRYQVLPFRNAAMDEGRTGMPDMRFITVPIALPGVRGSVVEVVSADYETIPGFDPAPVPTFSAPTEKNPTGKVYRSAFTPTTEYYPGSAASIENPAAIRGWIVGYLKLYPVQYQAAARSARKCTRMVVRVTYGTPDRRMTAAHDDAWARAAVLNYATARSWYASSPSLAKSPVINSVRATGQWFKLEVTQDGMYKIDATYLRALGVDPSSLASIRDVKIFGGDGHALSTAVKTPKDVDLSQCAVQYVDQNANGRFDTDDYVLFYGKGPNGWVYDPSSRLFSHAINPFTASNYYLLQIAGGAAKEMQAMSSPASAPTTVTTSIGKIFFDEDKFNFNQSGQQWVGAPMSERFLSRVVTNKLTGYVPGSLVTYRYDFFGVSTAGSSFTIDESGVNIAQAYIAAMSESAIQNVEGNYAEEAAGEISVVPALTDDRSTVRMSYVPNAGDAKGFINWLEIIYQQQLTASGDLLQFTSPDANGAVEYPLSGFTTNAVAGYDVSDINNVKKIDLQLQQQMGVFRFRDQLASGAVKSYWIGASSAYLTPKSSQKLPTTNLHGNASGADFVIITHHDFVGEAQRLKTHKEQGVKPSDRLTTMVVDVDSIYNEFGNGMPDPTAIRNYLLYASQRWQTPPRYVLLFGDASYDYKGLAGTDRGWVPTYESFESNNKIESTCMDDYFARLDTTSSDLVTVSPGRIAVRSVEEARSMVDRIIRYELHPAQDQWKNTITIVADDEWTPDVQTEYYHTDAAEELAQQYTPSLFDVKKIYIADYPVVITPQGRRKPDARQTIIDQVNRGTLILNYTGHGNPTVWAHESILTLEDTKSQFVNIDKPTFVVAATCDWGRFDATDVQSSAEEMMKNTQGGAIGVLSAVRAVYAGDNAQLNTTFYTYALLSDPFDSIPRLGDAYLLTKNDPQSGSFSNTEKYHMLGDPTLRLAIPRLALTIDSINGIATASSAADTLNALQKVTIKGSVRNQDLSINQSLNGTALVAVYDANRDKLIAEFGFPYTYVQPGAVLYKGENSIVNGKLEATFIVPKDISYDSKNGGISVYFTSDANDGRGQTSKFIVGGTSRVASTDSQGPSVSVYFDTPSFHSGDLVGDQPELIVALSDSSGINSAGTGIGHRIEAWIDGSPKSIDLTEYYKSKKDSYQEGTVTYQMAKVEPGSHSVLVKAWDVYNNPASAEVSFVVASADGLSLQNVYNIPNPARRATTFTFQHNQLTPVDVQIKIYSVAGRLITQIDRNAMTDRFVEIPWDLRDNDGDVLGNGVYFYKVLARTTDGKFSSEALGKLVVMK